MSRNKISFNYDKQGDILFIYNSEKKSKGSIEYGENMHICFDPKKQVVGLEILDASRFLTSLTKTKVGKINLSNMVKCDLKTKTHKGLLYIKFFLLMKEQTIEKDIILQDIKYHSPIMAYA